jgi:hypothetical protein
MKNLPLNVSKYSKDKSHQLQRNYFWIKIEYSTFGEEELEVVKQVGASVQKLTICHITFKSPEHLQSLLDHLKLLKILILIRVELDFAGEITAPEYGTTLDKLEAIQINHRVFQYLKNHQVLNFEITDGFNARNPKSLVEFLKEQRKLESMSIENLSNDSCALFGHTENSIDFAFRLKRLSVLYSHIRDVEVFEAKFTDFLRLHEESLREMKVEGSLPHQIYKIMLMKLSNVVDLEVNVGELPQEISFYDGLPQNRKLKVLRLNRTIKTDNLNGFKGLLQHYPNIQKVSLADTDSLVPNDVFHLLSVKLPKLSDLSVLNFHGNFAVQIVFPSLKHFSIRILVNTSQWLMFIKRNDSIESLSVGWINRDQLTTPTLINEITDLPNLRHLKFGGRFIASKRIFDVIKRNYKNLRTLRLAVANYEEIKKLTFVFPIDRSLWVEKCQYFDEGHDREPLND